MVSTQGYIETLEEAAAILRQLEYVTVLPRKYKMAVCDVQVIGKVR